MGGLSLWHWAALAAVVLLILGSTRIPRIMGELGKGVKAFRQNIRDDDKDQGGSAGRDSPK